MAKKSEVSSAQPFVPEGAALGQLAKAVQDCRGCDLYRNATQGVFGEGPTKAKVILIGEQPGDQEDRAGVPFVGPAGKLLDRALRQAGIDRAVVYVTNAVKHFKFRPEGKRRIHERPNAREIAACRAWLEAEMDEIHPDVIVCLGATAAKAVFGSAYRVTKQRGTFVEHAWAPSATSTVHPSAILRAPDDESRERAYTELVRDLRGVRRRMSRGRKRSADQ